MPDEVVMANVGNELLLSHPQSNLWLSAPSVASLIQMFFNNRSPKDEESSQDIPEWLSVSTGAERLLISDQRNGRWVLLGADHISELERRLPALQAEFAATTSLAPPTISVCGLQVHLQSALMLAETLEVFASSGQVNPFEEATPTYSLAVSAGTGGMELRDSDRRVALGSREARKWSSLLRAELERLEVKQFERGMIRTVFAAGEDGRWVLQWGDEVFVPNGLTNTTPVDHSSDPIKKDAREFLLLLNPDTGGCVALTDSESSYLTEAGCSESIELR
ncbi:MAG: hypothetical protein WAV47_18920 [Blastocatellia bacterium]